MPSFSIEVRGLDSLIKRFKEAPEVVELYTQRAIDASIQEVFRHATSANVPYKTGRLVRSFGEGITIGRLYGMIGPTVEYAAKVHEKSSKPNYMPRIAGKAEPRVIDFFEAAAKRVTDALAG